MKASSKTKKPTSSKRRPKNGGVESGQKLTTAKLVEGLREMQKWRRGIPPYDNPGVEMPLSPREFGEYIDKAIEIIEVYRSDHGISAGLAEHVF